MSKAKPKAKSKAKVGRPTSYKEEYAELAFNYCLLGATDIDLAKYFGVSEKTINTWKAKQPEFLQSLKAGKDEADAKVAQSLYHRATGYSHQETKIATHEGMITDSKEFTKHYAPDPTSAIFWLKNRQSGKWRDKQELVVEVEDASIDKLVAARERLAKLGIDPDAV